MYKSNLIPLFALLLFLCNWMNQAAAQQNNPIQQEPVRVHDTTMLRSLVSDTTTTLIVLRHAEKETTGTDPNLNADGILRAEELRRLLSNVAIHTIYSTPFNRTRQTVQPLATGKGLAITEYSTASIYTQLLKDIVAANRGKVAVIVGHSNTVPEILQAVSNNTFNVTITDREYDNLFIVTIPTGGQAVVTHLKYGKETP